MHVCVYVYGFVYGKYLIVNSKKGVTLFKIMK